MAEEYDTGISSRLEDTITRRTPGLSTDDIIDKLVMVGEKLTGKKPYPYQLPFIRRLMEAILERESEEVTALWSRQCIGGDEIVLDRDGSAYRMSCAPGSFQTGIKPTYRLVASGGYSINHVTLEHVFFDEHGDERPLSDFKVGDRIQVVTAAPKWVCKRSWGGFDRGLLLGMLTSDGYFAEGQGTKFTNTDPELIELFSRLVVSEFPGCSVSSTEKGNGWDIHVKKSGPRRPGKNDLNLWLESIQWDHGFPVSLFDTDPDTAWGFVSGMALGDGCVQNTDEHRHLEIGTGNSPVYAHYLQALLMKLGVRSKVKRERMHNVGGALFQRVIISGKDSISKLSPLKLVSHKGRALAGLIATSAAISNPKHVPVRATAVVGEDGEALGTAKIVSVEPTGVTMPVYDRKVPGKEWFYCQGFRAHNSGKSDSISFAASTLMVMLPALSEGFKEDDRFCFYDADSGYVRDYTQGFWIGIFAPKKEQAGTIFNRIRSVLRRKEAVEIMNDLGITYETNNGDTFRLSNGSFVKCSTASEQANIEGATLHLAILEESQDISDQKANKSIGPMLASCLTGDTRITCSDGATLSLLEAVESRARITVPCVDHTTSRMTKAKVSGWVDSGEQECLTVTLQSGRVITGTMDHPLLVRERIKPRGLHWRRLLDISTGDHVCLPDYLPCGSLSVGEDSAYWLGAMIGNGCASDDHSPRFSHEDPTILREMSDISSRLGCSVRSEERPDYASETYRELTFTGSIRGENPASRLLRSHGLYGVAGKGKRLGCLTDLTIKDLTNLIAGLFDTDGHVLTSSRGGMVCFSQANKPLVMEVLEVLHRIGVHGTVRETHTKERVLRGRVLKATTSWLLVVAGKRYVRRFHEAVTLRCPHKQAVLLKAVSAFSGHKEKVSDQFPGIVWDKVISTIPAGVHRVYDLTVPGHHSFVANGVISHNTGGSIVKIGTANARKSHFYLAIKRNERRHHQGGVQNHFLVHWKDAAKCNQFYLRFVVKEMQRLGETSDEFRMNYEARFMLERGVAISEDLFYSRTVTTGFGSDILPGRRPGMNYVAGIDFGKMHDSTVVTVLEVGWNDPRQVLEGFDEESGSFQVEIFGKHVVDWLELQGDDYEAQYVEIQKFLAKWCVERIALDYTGVGTALGDRFKSLYSNVDVEFVTYSDDSKDALGRQLLADLHTGMLTWPGGEECQQRREFKNFKSQILDTEKDYNRGLLNLHHPDIAGAHDDYTQSICLAVHAANTRPFGGDVEDSMGSVYRR